MKKIFLSTVLATTSIASQLTNLEVELMQMFTDAIDYGDYKKFEEIFKNNPNWISKNKSDLIQKTKLILDSTVNLEKHYLESYVKGPKSELDNLSVTGALMIVASFLLTPGAIIIGIEDHTTNNRTRIPFHENKIMWLMLALGAASGVGGAQILKSIQQQNPSKEQLENHNKMLEGIIASMKLIQAKRFVLNNILIALEQATDSNTNTKG